MDRHGETDSKKICPLCGGPNDCRAGELEPCWCNEEPVSKEALAMEMGDFSLDTTCLCKSCLSRFTTRPGERS
jgi:hypothetical protein